MQYLQLMSAYVSIMLKNYHILSMKPQNNEFLNNLLSKYSEFEGILH